ncbi:MAG TPA: hypothetical protein VNH17_19710 [Streptosporangiaceae bacterium]|jgi:hypothetical protein|nr:hypothetical protein [Streptosporangiaceae bacterium]
MADQGPVERATRAELRALKISVQTSILAASAVSLARHIDSCRGAVAAAAAAAQLRQTRADLLAEAEKRPERDVIDDLNARRAQRAAG